MGSRRRRENFLSCFWTQEFPDSGVQGHGVSATLRSLGDTGVGNIHPLSLGDTGVNPQRRHGPGMDCRSLPTTGARTLPENQCRKIRRNIGEIGFVATTLRQIGLIVTLSFCLKLHFSGCSDHFRHEPERFMIFTSMGIRFGHKKTHF